MGHPIILVGADWDAGRSERVPNSTSSLWDTAAGRMRSLCRRCCRVNAIARVACDTGRKLCAEASEQLLEFLHREMSVFDCTVFVTHDLFAAALMSFLGLKAPCREDWCDYLEGVCVISGPEGHSYRRFLNRADDTSEGPC